MTARLGNALYALGCMLAAAVFLFEASLTMTADLGDGAAGRWIGTAFIALIAWLLGRGCRYVLAGR